MPDASPPTSGGAGLTGSFDPSLYMSHSRKAGGGAVACRPPNRIRLQPGATCTSRARCPWHQAKLGLPAGRHPIGARRIPAGIACIAGRSQDGCGVALQGAGIQAQCLRPQAGHCSACRRAVLGIGAGQGAASRPHCISAGPSSSAPSAVMTLLPRPDGTIARRAPPNVFPSCLPPCTLSSRTASAATSECGWLPTATL